MTCLWTLPIFTALQASVSKLFLSNYCIRSRTPTVPSPSPIHSRNIAIEAAATNAEFTVLIFWSSIPCVFCLHVYTLVKVVGYYDLSGLSMSVIVFQKEKFKWGVGGWGELYPILFWIFGIVLTLQSP